MGYGFTICDVFADRALQGNQLAVFGDGAAVPDELLQPLAKEMGFSETVFVFAATDTATADARIRIFTPALELAFAGHPVLGTATVLATENNMTSVRLETGSGIVPVEVHDGFGRMSQPLPTVAPFGDTTALFSALGVERSELPVEIYDNGVKYVYVVLPNAEALAALHPDQRALAAAIGDVGASVVAGSGSRWKTRMFAPGAGIPEDPATGSAAGPLAVHLARHSRIDWGTGIVISQGAEIGRPSTLFATALAGPAGVTRVEVGGATVIVAHGEFELPG